MFSKAKQHFKKADPVLYAAACEIDIEDAKVSDDLFRDIVWTIVGQQLSSLAANAIFARFQKLFRGRPITPKRILALTEADMRACGLSGAKVRAIKNVAEVVHKGHLDIKLLSTLKDDDFLIEITKVKGVGPWTAQMLLMFSLGRPDVFSLGDLGLRKGIVQLYGFKTLPNEKRLVQLINQWSPYRTYAARVLWKVADKKTQRVARKRPSDGVT